MLFNAKRSILRVFSVWLVGVISTDAGALRKYLHWILVDGHWPFSALRAVAVDKTGCAEVGERP